MTAINPGEDSAVRMIPVIRAYRCCSSFGNSNGCSSDSLETIDGLSAVRGCCPWTASQCKDNSGFNGHAGRLLPLPNSTIDDVIYWLILHYDLLDGYIQRIL